MAPGGVPEDDLEVVPTRGTPSRRRSSLLVLAVAGLVLAATAPAVRAGGTDSAQVRLEMIGGPEPAAVATSTTVGEDTPVGVSTTVRASPTTQAGLVAQGVAPSEVFDALGVDESTTTTTRSPARTAPPPTFAPTTTARPSGTTTTKPPGATTSTTRGAGTTVTTKAPATTVTTKAPGTTVTTRPSTTTTTRPPTTTTRPTTTTTTRPPTTTTTQPPCTWSGRVQSARTGFVVDGQSNALSPTKETSFGVKLMQRRWPSAPYKQMAVGGTSYTQRSANADRRVDIHANAAPCMLLISHGGESDLHGGAGGVGAVGAAELAQRVKDYIVGRRAAGFDVFVVPTIPRNTWLTAAGDQQRLIFNDWLRSSYRSAGIDVLVDLAVLPQLQDPLDTRWFSDGSHYTDEAAGVVADAYSRALP